MEYPSNSNKQRSTEPREKVQRVTRSEVIQRKKPLGKRFKETFLGGDARGVGSYVVLDVLLPALKDMVADAGSQGLERMLYGEVRSTSRRGGYKSGGLIGHTPYNRAYRPDPREAVSSRRARATHDFGEFIIETRVEAEHVLNGLLALIEKYDQATVADLYDLLGVTWAYTDSKWGWTDLRGADFRRVREGYLLELPPTESL